MCSSNSDDRKGKGTPIFSEIHITLLHQDCYGLESLCSTNKVSDASILNFQRCSFMSIMDPCFFQDQLPLHQHLPADRQPDSRNSAPMQSDSCPPCMTANHKARRN